MSEISFKRVSSKDGEDICRIYNILKDCGENMYVHHGLTHWLTPYAEDAILRDVAEKDVYIAYMDGTAVGTFMMSKNRTSYFTDDIPAIYISKVAILPREEGKGIGGKCMKFIEEQALSEDIYCIRLDVYTKSERAINFYCSKGFSVVDEKPTRKFSVYCMEKRL